ncbi:Uncharacterised protein [Mycobacterium tuberculosis]|nr:Uncharacterised protein [Mycobacterium tuberculosis]
MDSHLSALLTDSQPCSASGSRLKMPKYQNMSCTSVGTLRW